ncbi:uncharacterized protein BDR25DRAFT_393466 [Lindgomyces ingoldianus]|uniref:Uncharacterized protein n=1 Tax=Lindgomyces ingoldianus TaxID=673940 RepID=A0ACB6QWF5_9PLEO|nr:uncharacterized protein BDR25DRAFT_393466 [Lindgomyces ingoldianus]KAF2471343.1 hypothetical protein BDR25DRAFT_393466 [Lindgomyces ingoldianus]
MVLPSTASHLPPSPSHQTLASTSTLPQPTNSTIPNATDGHTSHEPTAPPFKKQKRERKEKTHILHQSTFKKPLWTYFHLSLLTPDTTTATTTALTTAATGSAITSTKKTPELSLPDPDLDIDPLTTSTLLHPALSTFLGIAGTSMPLDILKTSGRDVWLRVPRQNARGLQAALSSWVGWCDADLIPGVRDMKKGRVRVVWRVNGSAEVLAGWLGEGKELFDG